MSDDAEPLAWRDHVGLIVTAAISAAFIGRLLAVSRFDHTTMLAILQHAAPATTLFAFVGTTGVYLAGGVAMGWQMASAAKARRAGRPIPAATKFAIAGVVLATLVVVSWFAATLIAIFALIDSAGPKWLRSAAAPDSRPVSRASYVAAAVALALGILMGDDDVWLPREQLHLVDGVTVSGYVLEREASELVFLQDKDRVVRRLSAQSVETTEFCTQEKDAWHSRSLLELIGLTPRYPLCN